MAGALADTNGDGYADDIALRFIVPGEPTAWEWCALADLAAVLGLHVTGFSPPLVVEVWDGPTLLLDPNDHATLAPGNGRVTLDGDRLTARGGDAAGRAAVLRALAQGAPPESGEWHVTAAQYPEPTPRPLPSDPGPPPDRADLFMAYGNPDRAPGLLVDTDGDRLADDSRCCFVVSHDISRKTGMTLVDAAARLGVETAGLTVPLCAPGDLGAAVPVCIADAKPDDGRAAFVIAGETEAETAALLRDLATGTPIDTAFPVFAEPQPVKEAVWSWEWEGRTERDILLSRLQGSVLALPTDAPCSVVIQISEDAAQRAALGEELRALFPAGSSITVLPVHHAGRAWLEEVVAPAAMKLPGLATLDVTCAPLYFPPEDGPYLDLPIRWLQECWPADEIIAPMLGLPLEKVRIRLREAGEKRRASGDGEDREPAYYARALDAAGATLGEWQFMAHGHFRVYLTNKGNGDSVFAAAGNARVDQAETDYQWFEFDTDLHAFWDEWTMFGALPQLRDYVLAQHAAGSTQPFFDELRIEVWVSEPERALGVREERESPGEGLAEDLYFNTLDYFHALGIQTTGAPWDAPGQIVPLVHIAPGEPPRAKVTLYRYDTAQTTYAPIPVQERASGVRMDEVVTGANLPGLLAYVNRFDAVTVRNVGRSYRGRTLAAVEVVKPDGAAVRSRAKLAAMKPTHLIVARHHANEVSSTTAAFRLIELLASDPESAPLLNRANVILIPDENPDGTALHAELMAEHPTWKHHAARYNAVGVEHAFHMWHPQTPYGEARVRPLLWKQWRPDVITDNHGVPSHEWWQPFAGGQNPPRFGISYWLCQALIYGICRHPPDAPHAAFAAALRDAVSRAIAADPEIAAANALYAERYARWGHRYVPEKFPATYHGDMLWFFGPAEEQPGSLRRNVAVQEAAMLSASWVTEVIDETAQGDHLALVARAHLTANLALLRLTARHAPPVAFSATPLPGGYVRHRLHRMRPLPAPMEGS